MSTHVLIVDYSKLIRTSLRSLLGSVEGIASIHEADMLITALDCARRYPPTLVILELALPDGLSTQIIEPLKQLSPNLRIAMLTLLAGPAYRERCLQLGADWFFDKATGVDALLELVRQHAAANQPIHSNEGTLHA
jgi:DNA-binding NarL/FixJ family response regulator